MYCENKIYTLARVLVVSMLFCLAPAARAQDVTTDPLVQQQTDRANWEPGGKYWPGNFQDRGTITQRGGNVATTLTSKQNIGGWSQQTANIAGQWTYTIDLDAYHPWTVHSPFNNTTSASDSVSTAGEGREVTVDMSWNGTMVHPADGYDGAQGGGYPIPHGARDLFTFNITGLATGMYRLSLQEQQQTENPEQRWSTPTGSIAAQQTRSAQQSMGGFQDSASSFQSSSLLDVARENQNNPLPNQSSPKLRVNNTNFSEIIGLAKSGADVVKYGSGAAIGQGIYEITNIGFDSPGWATLATKLHAIENAQDAAGNIGNVLTVLTFALDTVNVATAANEGEFGDAVNRLVRDGVTASAVWAGAQGGAIGGGVIGAHFAGIGALVGAPLGALAGGLGAHYGAGLAYDAWLADPVTDFAQEYYRQQIVSGTVASNVWQSVTSDNFQTTIFAGGGGGGGGGGAK